MVNKVNSCVIISGNGSNLKKIIENSQDYSFPISVKLVISNNIKAKGLKFAKQFNIPFMYIPFKNRKNFLSYSYVLHKFLELLGEDEYLQYFPSN